MGRNFTTLMERPDNGNIFASLIYEVVAFFSLPFLLLLVLNGTFGTTSTTALLEILYHGFNFFVAVFIYREYLTDTFADIHHNFSHLLKTSSRCIVAILMFALVLHSLFAFSGDAISLTAYGALPLAEVDLFILPSSVIFARPVMGIACMVVLAPVAVSCLFYATVFAPICYTRPVLAYLAMAVFLAFPRFCNAATFWEPTSQWVLYFTQLPIHLMACRSYQKADSIWAPILTLSVVNGVACLLLYIARFTGIL